MNILHIQRSSAFFKTDFQQCIASFKPNDALVLMDDGCYNVNHPLFTAFKTLHPSAKVFYIQTHANARAINFTSHKTYAITTAQLVALTFKFDSIITWQ